MFFLDFNKKNFLELLLWTVLLILLISGLVMIVMYHKEFYGYGYLSWFVIYPLLYDDENWLLIGHLKRWTKPGNKLINVLILANNGIILLVLVLLSVFSVVGNN